MAAVRIEEMPWDEAERAIGAAKGVLLPLGARLKEHGLHLPLNNDWLLANYLAERASEQIASMVRLATRPRVFGTTQKVQFRLQPRMIARYACRSPP